MAVGADPIHPIIEKGYLKADSGPWREALPGLRDSLDASGGEDCDVMTALGWGLYYTGQMHEAEGLFKRVLERAPETVGADLGYVYVLRHQDRFQEAILFALGVWDNPENGPLQLFLSDLLLGAGNAGQAYGYVENWFKLSPEHRDFRELMARILAAVGEWHEAVSVSSLMLRAGDGDSTMETLLRMLRALTHANPGSTVAENLKTFEARLGGTGPGAWICYQLARNSLCAEPLDGFAEEPDPPVKPTLEFSYAVADSDRNVLAGEDDGGGTWKTPVIDEEKLRRNIAAFTETAKDLIENGRFDTWTHNFDAFRQAFGQTPRPPVFVLSTGRCGTLALLKFLERSDQAIAYHTLAWQLSAADRNHMLYRILEGKFDPEAVAGILRTYLECRSAEVLHALRTGRSLMIVNHLDTVFAPFNAVFFPDSRFLYVHRDPAKVYASMLTKSQWGGQLQHWSFDPAFAEGRFHFRRDETLALEAEVAWYLHLTRTFTTAFLDTVAAERRAEIKSEELFSRDAPAYERLMAVLPIDDLSMEMFEETFAQPINKKDTMVDDQAAGLVDEKGFGKYLLELERNGRFGG
ncbi:MAG: tetratricopeptide repeat protein [Proteobacteria bacterium]|nr:tetratricopeptide repeat protein [Pseudomonadota bacterium]